jgi:CDP-paratose 2-epimerase
MQPAHDANQRSVGSATLNDGPIVITGGAGFIGSNLAHRLLREGREVWLYDNLSRRGVEDNARALAQEFGSRARLIVADTRDAIRVREVVSSAAAVFHFAAQVAVTSSIDDPELDFAVNLQGTLNVLEALRRRRDPPPLLYTSTNKVYGSLSDVALREDGDCVVPADSALSQNGISEARNLDFHSPYGCSKGAADQYVIDYARTYGLRAAVFRMSCIYGPRQCGNEDQGWVAHFLIQAMKGRPLTLYGDGKQVRDILYVDDLLDAMLRVQARMGELGSEAYNIGGGPANAVSLLQVVRQIEELTGESIAVRFAEPRLGDQRYYVTDTRKFASRTGWSARVGHREGIGMLHQWLSTERASALPRVAPRRSNGASVAT